MRLSKNEVISGAVWNGFDYALQVWVLDGEIQQCGHPDSVPDCCNACRYAGEMIVDVPGREIRMD